jgi:hypothetical protein
MSDASVIASALYGTPSAPASTALTNAPAARDTASALYGDGKPAAPVAAPRAPAAAPVAAPAARARGVETADERLNRLDPHARVKPAAPAPLRRGREPEEDDDAPAAKPVGNAAYAARAAAATDADADEPTGDEAEQQADEQNDDQQNDDERIEYAPSDEALSYYGSTMRSLVSADVNRLGADPTAAEANAAEVAGIMEAFQVPPADADFIVETAIGAAANGVTPQKQQQWRQASRDALAIEYGPGSVSKAIALSRKLVAAHPAVRAYLHQTGLGDAPPVVRAVAAHAWRLAAEGKL